MPVNYTLRGFVEDKLRYDYLPGRIPLVPQAIRKQFNTADLGRQIFISYANLAEFLEEGEEREELVKSGNGIILSHEGNILKRRRDSTPPQDLRLDDEERVEDDCFVQKECGEKEDKDFVALSSKSRRSS